MVVKQNLSLLCSICLPNYSGQQEPNKDQKKIWFGVHFEPMDVKGGLIAERL